MLTSKRKTGETNTFYLLFQIILQKNSILNANSNIILGIQSKNFIYVQFTSKVSYYTSCAITKTHWPKIYVLNLKTNKDFQAYP